MLSVKIEEAIGRHALIRPGNTIVIGVSGGPDSVALTLALHALRPKFRLKLIIAHFDHRLRADSAQDASFVRELGARLSIPVIVGRADARLARQKGSLEEAARSARLRFFARVALRERADAVAVGHNRDDQAETVLMRLLRGTGLCGLAGIIPKRRIGAINVIRPLLDVSRAQITAYLRRRKTAARSDSTNDSDMFFRNRVRHELLPLLERRYNRNIRSVLVSLADNAAGDYDFIVRSADRIAARGSQTRLSLALLRKAHPALVRILLRRAVAAIQGNTRRLTFQHIRELEDLIHNRPTRSIVDLPKGISAKSSKTRLVIYRR